MMAAIITSVCYNLTLVTCTFLPNLYAYLGVNSIEFIMNIMAFIASGGIFCTLIVSRISTR